MLDEIWVQWEIAKNQESKKKLISTRKNRKSNQAPAPQCQPTQTYYLVAAQNRMVAGHVAAGVHVPGRPQEPTRASGRRGVVSRHLNVCQPPKHSRGKND